MPKNSERQLEIINLQKNQKIPSLTELALTAIAQKPGLSLSMLNNETIEFPKNIKEFLNAKTPFIEMLPQEILIHILSFVSEEEWFSLLKVNKQWRRIISDLASVYLSSVKDRVGKTHTQHKIDGIMHSLLTSLQIYELDSRGRRTNQVDGLKMMLGKEIPVLTSPLAKLFYLQKKLQKVMSDIENERTGSLYFFRPESNSRLYQLCADPFKTYLSVFDKPWFKKTLLYARCAPKHEVSKLLSSAFLEIKGLTKTKTLEEAKGKSKSTTDKREYTVELSSLFRLSGFAEKKDNEDKVSLKFSL